MTVSRGLALLLSVGVAGAFAHASGPAPASSSIAGLRLTAISSRVHGKGASLVIETNEPAPYIATRPDPLTVVVDLRNVLADGVANSVAADGKSPIAAVSIEPTDEVGRPTSRVRIRLAQPVAHRVRSERNTIVVDFDKPSAKGAPYVMPPAARQAGAPSAAAALGWQAGAPGAAAALGWQAGAPGAAAALGWQAAPDAMQALQLVTDPIAAMGLGKLPLQERIALAPGVAAALSSPAPAIGQVPTQIPVPPASPQAPQPPAPGQPGTPRAPARFTGHPVSLDFQGADLRAVLRTFSEISGLNMVIDPAVQGTVDVALRDVPWDQALDIILRANKLGYLVDGTIVRIAPLAALADEETQRRKLSDEQALAGELRVLTRTLSYAKAEDLKDLLTKSALSQRGTVQVDPRTNTVIITDLSDRLTTATDLLTTLDRPQPQVEIEARIIQTSRSFARQLGVQWGFMGRVDPALGNTTNLAFPNKGSLAGQAGPAGTAVNLPVPGAPSAVGLLLGSVNGAFNLDVALSALESSGQGRTLSTPRVSTQNNVEAEITQGVQIPIQTVANNTVTVTFKDAALTLKVTPQITSAGTVIMKISVENASPDFSRAVNNIPPINTQRANTQVLVSDGQTTVIGGIYLSDQQTQNDHTPGLYRVPLLGWLFKRDRIDDSSKELLIFITPRIIKG